MPLMWRYLLKKIISIFSLSIFSFIIVLLITRTHDIARFAILSSDPGGVAMFVLCQIPYILPIAIPLSCLISAFMTMNQLSSAHEVTAFRSLGFNLKALLTPILLLGLFLGCVNFMVAAELTPRARKVAQKLIFSSTMNNPLFLLQSSGKLGMQDTLIDMKTGGGGKVAKDVLFATKNDQTEQIILAKIDQLELEEEQLMGKNMVLITHGKSEDEASFDPLFIENQNSIRFSADFLCNLLENKQFRDEPKHWELGSLVHYLTSHDHKHHENYYKAFFELERRSFFALITFLLMWLGSVLGISVGRLRSKKNIVLVTFYPLLGFVFALVAKSFSKQPMLFSLLFATPLLIMILGALFSGRKILRGQV